MNERGVKGIRRGQIKCHLFTFKYVLNMHCKYFPISNERRSGGPGNSAERLVIHCIWRVHTALYIDF